MRAQRLGTLLRLAPDEVLADEIGATRGAAIFAEGLPQAFDQWADPLLNEGHSLGHYGKCEVCGDWKVPPYVPSPSLGHGCRHFDEVYRRDPEVLTVPAHHGDTSTGRHQADALFVEAHHPADAIRRCTRDLAVITRHQTRAQVYPHVQGIVEPDHCWSCAKPSPCLELVDLAESLGIEVTDG